MRIVVETADAKEQQAAETLKRTARGMGIDAHITTYRNAFSLVTWSVDDITNEVVGDDRVDALTEEQKIAFLEHCDSYIANDMIARGHASYEWLFGEWIESINIEEKGA